MTRRARDFSHLKNAWQLAYGLPPPPKRGRPRRGKGRALITSVRIDTDAYEVLKREFGSLGNALHYLYQGIVQFRETHRIYQHAESRRLEQRPEFTYPDIIRVIEALAFQADDCDKATCDSCNYLLGKIRRSVGAKRVDRIIRIFFNREGLPLPDDYNKIGECSMSADPQPRRRK